MSSYINKTYTDHPLMDEICYNCKRILKGIVIKNDVLARYKETENSMTYADMYMIYHDKGFISFDVYPFNTDVLYAYYGDSRKASTYAEDKYRIPEEDREDLIQFANEYFVENFEEENDYYRMLIGLPPYAGKQKDGSNEYDIFIVDSDIPTGYTGDFYPDKPLHEQPLELLQVLYSEGVIDKLRETYPGSNYSYMLYLADRSIDLYTARKAGKWDILYIPNVYYLVEESFKEVYNKNKTIYINRSYQDYFAQTGDYYDQLMILIVLCETFSNLITDVPEWYIRRDIFDLRSCQYFLESYGVEYFDIIPLKYQIRLVKKLNRLIKYKSSTYNINDIIEIFTSDAKVYKYWLYKEQDPDSGEYDLEFVSSPIGESYDEYIEDASRRKLYDDITLEDKYWDGDDTHAYVKQQILEQDFTIRGTKYMSIEYEVPLSKYLYQMSYLLGTILDSNNNLNDITIPIPSIDETANFKLSNLFLLLVVLTNSYDRQSSYDASTRIIYPDNISDGAYPTINEDRYNYKVKYFPEIYANKTGRVCAFNTELDVEKLRKELQVRHSKTRFGQGDTENAPTKVGQEYLDTVNAWIDTLQIDKFISGGNFKSIDEIMDYYNTNTEVYDNLRELRLNSDNQDERAVLDYIFQELFTRKYDTAYYTLSDGTIANDLVDILKDKDYILYSAYNKIITESNTESRQSMLRSLMNDVIDTLEYYFYDSGIDYLFSFTTVGSFFSIVNYIYLLIGFFKSYKVYFLDPYFTYKSDDKLENFAGAIDTVTEWQYDLYHWDSLKVQDIISNIKEDMYLSSDTSDTAVDIVEIYSHNEFDPYTDYDYDAKYAEELDSEAFEINGFGANEEAAPYIMVNGGYSYLGKVNIDDINGSGAYEYPNREYFIIDGGYAFNKDDEKTNGYGTQMFTYVVDGGSADGRYFSNNSMEVYLITSPDDLKGTEYIEKDKYGRRLLNGTEIFANVNISPRCKNYFEINDDGLSLPISNLVEDEVFNNTIDGLDTLIKYIKTDGERILADIKVMAHVEDLENRIKDISDSITYDMEYVLDQYDSDTFIKRIKAAVDEMIKIGLTDVIGDANPYSWTDI